MVTYLGSDHKNTCFHEKINWIRVVVEAAHQKKCYVHGIAKVKNYCKIEFTDVPVDIRSNNIGS